MLWKNDYKYTLYINGSQPIKQLNRINMETQV